MLLSKINEPEAAYANLPMVVHLDGRIIVRRGFENCGGQDIDVGGIRVWVGRGSWEVVHWRFTETIASPRIQQNPSL
ncbi:hypothetical protein THS27_02700 [Thalassospira sp. MCCC 1A01428]|nr:hypothetical protein THS27_02700 [Thalassospira sp. MCCC 1A01428]